MLLTYVMHHFGAWGLNYAGSFVYWFDIGIWSALEDQAQTFLGF